MHACGLDVLGAGNLYSVGSGPRYSVGDWSDLIPNILKAGGEVASTAITYKKEEDAKSQAIKDSNASLQAAIDADNASTDASAQALYSADIAQSLPDGPAKAAALQRAQADIAMATQAASMQDIAGAGLSAALTNKRMAAAQAALTDAMKKSAAAAAAYASAPNDSGKKAAAQQASFRAKAAQATAIKAANGQIVSATTPAEKEKAKAAYEKALHGDDENFLTKKLGPLPVYGWGLGALGAGIATKLIFFGKK